MRYRTLIAADVLARHISDPNWIVIDCRFSLADPTAGEYAYGQGHIPGAYYAHLDHQLASVVTEETGRHPLPSSESFARLLGGWGVNPQSQVVVYDDVNGAFAGRLWWMLTWMGHENVAVLDGGWQTWCAGGWGQQQTTHAIVPASYYGGPKDEMWCSTEQVELGLEENTIALIDARAAERYRGEVEPIDPVAGHVPGAINRAFQLNLDQHGLFKTPQQLHAEFSKLLTGRAPTQAIHMCGSGVTACHNLLAMEHAGLSGSRLYVGSWSEWIRGTNRPVGKGG